MRWRDGKQRKERLIEGKRMEGRAGVILCSLFPFHACRPGLYVLPLWAGTDRKREGHIREEGGRRTCLKRLGNGGKNDTRRTGKDLFSLV